MQKNIKDMTTEELEKAELQLWRQRENATITLQQTTNDLNLITSELATRNQAAQNASTNTSEAEVVE